MDAAGERAVRWVEEVWAHQAGDDRARGDGATSADIARLVPSPATVESHVRNAMMRLGARNRTHASILALQRGEIALQPPGPAEAG